MAKISINLVRIRLEQAEENLIDAKYLFEKDSYKGANNRAYYSIFHTMKAVLAIEPIDFKRHKDVIAYFNQNYINKEIFPRELGHEIKKAEIIRDNSDYNDFYVVSKNDSENIIKTASELLDYGTKFIKDWCETHNVDLNLKE